MIPASMDTKPPTRSAAAVTAVASLAIVAGGLGSIISVITAAMFAVGSYGTKNAGALDALITIAGPPLTLIAGIGLLRRRRWAGFTIVAILIGILAWQASDILSPAASEDRTFVAPNGVLTTTMGSGPTYSLPIIAVCIAALAALFSAKSRAEFSPAPDPVMNDERPESGPTRGDYDAAEERDTSRGWRVGHRGRDQMFYEERRDGKWQRIELDGEMLLGRTHHVIYFASAETWQRYPEWARHRRDEIIARIKSAFGEPDYEYADGGTARETVVPPVAAAQPMKRSELRALLAFLLIFLGITGGMTWLVGTGLQRGETYWPAKRASQQRTVSREKEPAMFWTSIGVYSAIGLGSFAFSICMIRWSRKSQR
jgi:hypothetical protein